MHRKVNNINTIIVKWKVDHSICFTASESMNSIKNSSSPSVGKANTLFSAKQDFKTVSYVS